ncbi:MAG: hypothetical protein PHE89_01535 [Alphaproteobacteria bacterium]|nr:hypothetical protein [Alphaproteobacteria bacterium]
MSKKIVIFEKEVALTKPALLDFIARKMGREESCYIVNGVLFFAKNAQVSSEKELMTEVVSKLEEATNIKLTKDGTDWIFAEENAISVGEVVDFFFKEDLNKFQIEANPLFQRKLETKNIMESLLAFFSLSKLFRLMLMKKESV